MSGLSGTATSWDTTAGGEGGRGRTWGSGGKRLGEKAVEVVRLARAPRGDANELAINFERTVVWAELSPTLKWGPLSAGSRLPLWAM